VIDGKVMVGVSSNELERLAHGEGFSKVSSRDFAALISRGGSGGTTVAGSSFAAFKAGIRVFATGGIGGVHRNPAMTFQQTSPSFRRRQLWSFVQEQRRSWIYRYDRIPGDILYSYDRL